MVDPLEIVDDFDWLCYSNCCSCGLIKDPKNTHKAYSVDIKPDLCAPDKDFCEHDKTGRYSVHIYCEDCAKRRGLIW